MPPIASEPEKETKPAQGAGVSLWHKIFGSPGQQADRIAESKSAAADEHVVDEQVVEGASRDIREDLTRGSDDESAFDGGREDYAATVESWSEESIELEIEESGEVQDRPGSPTEDGGEPRRRRRRRGRGRGRRSDTEAGNEEQARGQSDGKDDGERKPREARVERAPRARSGRSGRTQREDNRQHTTLKDDLDDGLEEIVLDDEVDSAEQDFDAVGDEAADTTSRGAPSGHKSIPSWGEAIGMIVETNLATRTERRRSAPSQSRGSGSTRGRSRGGRRRKKS